VKAQLEALAAKWVAQAEAAGRPWIRVPGETLTRQIALRQAARDLRAVIASWTPEAGKEADFAERLGAERPSPVEASDAGCDESVRETGAPRPKKCACDDKGPCCHHGTDGFEPAAVDCGCGRGTGCGGMTCEGYRHA
jgi:hypothetical protein